MHWGVNCLLKHLNLDVFIKWVILFEGLLIHPNLLVLLCSLRKAISLEFQLLFCLVVWLQIQRLLFTQHLLLKHDVESPFNLLSVHFCVCQLPPNTFWVCHRAFTRVTCWWWIENNSVCPSVVLWESRADNAALDPWTDSTSRAVNTESWPVEAGKQIPHSYFTSSWSQPHFPQRGSSVTFSLALSLHKNLWTLGFVWGWDPFAPRYFCSLYDFTNRRHPRGAWVLFLVC